MSSVKKFNPVLFRQTLLFLLLLLLIALLYNYHQIAFLKPVGIHQWRSCVSAAFPVNLARGGSFFATQTNNLLSDNFSSDATVVEFPLIYFMISILYRIFGENVFWFRMFQVVIGFIGLIYLFKASYYFTGNWFYAAFIPLIIFTSPVFVFYLNGFIPDSVALSMTFIGFYHYLVYSRKRKFSTWLVSMLFFLLAGLTKTSSLLPYLAIAGAALMELLSPVNQEKRNKYFEFKAATVLSFLAVILLVFAWYIYAKVFSDLHQGSVSSVEIRPIWRMDSESIQASVDAMKMRVQKGEYHSAWFLYLSAALFVFNLFFPKAANQFLYRLNILVFLGGVAFTLLFFRSMRNHDYYLINMLFIFIPIYLTFFSILARKAPHFYSSPWPKMVLGIMVVILVLHCREIMNFRYSEKDAHYLSAMEKLEMFDIEDYLREIGVKQDDRVYCTPDPSINISLFLCGQKGRTDVLIYTPDYKGYTGYWGLPRLSLEERMDHLRETGVEYVILGSREKFMEIENLDDILGEKIGQSGNTEVFRIRPTFSVGSE